MANKKKPLSKIYTFLQLAKILYANQIQNNGKVILLKKNPQLSKPKDTTDKVIVPVETSLSPLYYQDFHCIAADCQDSCCLNWRIEFDKKDFLRLRRLEAPEDFKQRLNQTVQRLRNNELHQSNFYGKFDLSDGRCPLLDDDSLCSLQKHCGGDALPFVCRIFPRQHNYTVAALEHSLTLGCESVLQLLWDLPEGIDFVEESLNASEKRAIACKKGTLESYFPQIRSMCVDILQNRMLSMGHRLLFLGVALQELIDMDWDNPNIPEWEAHTNMRLQLPDVKNYLASLTKDVAKYLMQNVSTTLQMYQSGETFVNVILKQLDWVFNENKSITFDVGLYAKALRKFQETFGDIEYFFENIMVSILFHETYPHLQSKETLWKDYVNLCNLYSFYRFAAVTGWTDAPTKKQLMHILVMTSRVFLHNHYRMDSTRDDFFKNESATLAHMAVLVNI